MSVGKEHCIITTHGKKVHVKCKHCEWEQDYFSDVVARRMASNHIVTKHTDIAQPASKMPKPKKRPYTFINRKPRGAAAAPGASRDREVVNFCPKCGCHLAAVKVAMGL